jgi:DNA/RNA endonuclease YhcR with UshA esterase domain
MEVLTMKPRILAILTLVGALGAGCAPEAAAPPVITTAEAAAHLGREVRIRGRVFTCHACKGGLEGSWKLCLDAPCGSEPFAALLKPEVVRTLGEEKIQALEGKTVEIHGTITEFRGRPEIQVACPHCITVITN